MNLDKRIEAIMEILKKNGYVTRKYLIEKTKYSPTTMRRDLALLEEQGRIKCTYGGVEIIGRDKVPFNFRRHFMRKEKRAIAFEAAKLIRNGDTIFLDPSTTVSYLLDFLLEKRNLTVITTNLKLGMYLYEYGINVYTLAGTVTQNDTAGTLVGESLNYFNIDLGFMDATAISKDGYLKCRYENVPDIIRSIRRNCKKLVIMSVSDKFVGKADFESISLGDADYVICDKEIDESIRKRCKNTKFIWSCSKMHTPHKAKE